MIKFKTLIPLHVPTQFVGILEDGTVVLTKWNSSDRLVVTELKIDDQRPRGATLADATTGDR